MKLTARSLGGMKEKKVPGRDDPRPVKAECQIRKCARKKQFVDGRPSQV